ncbi:hypothetical protein BCV71DRAFT_151051, partial [Rhizopus microsporus]
LLTIFFALQLHTKRFESSTIRIFSDNITAIKYVSKSSGIASGYLKEVAIRIHEIRNKHQLDLQVFRIPGISNIQADKLSRKMLPLYEWTLPRRKRKMKIHTFVSRTNHRLPTYRSLRPDPLAKVTGAFQQKWLKKGLHLSPP